MIKFRSISLFLCGLAMAFGSCTPAIADEAAKTKAPEKTALDASDLIKALTSQNEILKESRIRALRRLGTGLEVQQSKTAEKTKNVEQVSAKITTQLQELQNEVESSLFYVDLERSTINRLHDEKVEKLDRDFLAVRKDTGEDFTPEQKQRLTDYHTRLNELDARQKAEVRKCDEIQNYILDGISARITNVLDVVQGELSVLDQLLRAQAKEIGPTNQPLGEAFEKSVREFHDLENRFLDKIKSSLRRKIAGAGIAGTAGINQLKSWERTLTADQQTTFIRALRARTIHLGSELVSDRDLGGLSEEIKDILSHKLPASCRLFRVDPEGNLTHDKRPFVVQFNWNNNGKWIALPETGQKKFQELITAGVIFAIQHPPWEDLHHYRVRNNTYPVLFSVQTPEGNELKAEEDRDLKKRGLEIIDAIADANIAKIRSIKGLKLAANGVFEIDGVKLAPLFQYEAEKDGQKIRESWVNSSYPDANLVIWNRWINQIKGIFSQDEIPENLR